MAKPKDVKMKTNNILRALKIETFGDDVRILLL
jgi:hypothetical protein